MTHYDIACCWAASLESLSFPQQTVRGVIRRRMFLRGKYCKTPEILLPKLDPNLIYYKLKRGNNNPKGLGNDLGKTRWFRDEKQKKISMDEFRHQPRACLQFLKILAL